MRRLPSEDPSRRLADILGAIARIDAYLAEVGGLEAFMRDRYLHRDAVERLLLIVAEAARKLRGQVDNLEPGINWTAIRGIGNFFHHDYDGVEDEIIERVIDTALKPLGTCPGSKPISKRGTQPATTRPPGAAISSRWRPNCAAPA